jgi:hypothetical protein
MGIYSMLPEWLLPAGLFLPGNANPTVARSTVPGMDETAMFGESVISQTHGCGKS